MGAEGGRPLGTPMPWGGGHIIKARENEVRLIPIIMLSSLIAFPAWAQGKDLKSIGETTEAMSDQKLVGPYIFARCAGLYDGTMGYGGANFPPDMQQTLKDGGG